MGSWNYFIFFIYVCVLIFFAVKKKSGFATWHMFAILSLTRFKIVNKNNQQKVNVWDYLPHTYITMSKNEALIFLNYLSDIHKLDIEGKFSCHDESLLDYEFDTAVDD